MRDEAFRAWRAAVVFFGNVPNVLLIGWIYFWLPRTRGEAVPGAFAFDVALFVVFAFVHSATASYGFKRWFAARFPAPLERPVFVIQSGVFLLLLILAWRPLPEVVWSLRGPAAWAVDGLFWLAFAGTASVSMAFDQGTFAGMRQLSRMRKGEPQPTTEFVVAGWFRRSRHPMYFFMIVLLWSASTATVGRLLFAALATTYFVLGLRLEERRLLAEVGERYATYQRHVPVLVPSLRPWTPPPEAAAAAR